MILAYDITNASLMFLGEDGVPRSADASHPNYQRLRDGLLDGAPADDLIRLSDTKVAIEGQCFGLVTVGNDAIWYKHQQLGGYLVEKLLALLGDGVDITPWATLLDKLMMNPDETVRERLPLFLEQAQMPLTMDGHFLAWRLVKDDYWDIYSGNTFLCTAGATISMPRHHVNPDPEQTCSAGIHVAAFGYLDSYGFNDSGRRCMLTKVNPAHVVAVPVDYNYQKLRVCEAILREVAKEYVPTLFGRDDHIVTEEGWVEDEDYPVAQWRDAVASGETTLGYDDWVEERHEARDTSSWAWKQAVTGGQTELSYQDWAGQQ